mmetsp:Transcript_13906/g.43611  ORF Transcript_13906/g.43611 Transcript_13906/m.43611 type:complete len:470 (-) Transcript_13906:83-1492(-)
MQPSSAEEAVLARATELYAEGMRLEDANEPQLALDRYRRAVRMADERKILARLSDDQAGTVTVGGSASSAAGAPVQVGSTAPANEEDFHLWRAMHLSRLEASAAGSADEPSTVPGRTPATVSAAAPAAAPKAGGRFVPPPRKPPVVSQELRETEEEAEVSDRMALRTLHGNLDMSNKASASDEASADSAPTVRARLSASSKSQTVTSQLIALLPEVLPHIFAFLDAYGLDRAARACTVLRRLTRGAAAWRSLARWVLPRNEQEDAAGRGERDWRRLVLFAPRARADGIYIAPCGYRRRIQKGSSITDSRESMYIRYFRLLRVLPDEQVEDPQRRVLVLTYEGELNLAVEALKCHPVGRAATVGASQAQGEAPGPIRKLHDRTQVGTYTLDREKMAVTVRYTDTRNEYTMEFCLSSTKRNGSRQNCRLTWVRYEFTSLTMPQDGGHFDLHREEHYSPYAFAHVRTLEHLL